MSLLFDQLSIISPILLALFVAILGSALFYHFYTKRNVKEIETRMTTLYVVISIVVIVSISIFILTFGSEEFRNKEFILGRFSTEMSDWGNFATCLTSVFTAVSVILAYKAFMGQQMQLRRASFDSLFTQLMSQHIFLYQKIKSGENGNVDIFRYYFTRLKDTKKIDVRELWKSYCYYQSVNKDTRLESYENLKNYFKFIYNEISLIQSYESVKILNKKLAKKYVLLIQAHMNNYELLCYLINLIDYYERTCHSNEKYLEFLKKYDFFKDLNQSIYFEDSVQKLKDGYPNCPIF